MKQSDDVIKLGKNDSCLVFREEDNGDVSLELFLANPGDDINEDATQSSILCTILASRVGEEEFVNDQYEWLNKRRQEQEDRELQDQLMGKNTEA